jgi:hypothetical protein
MSIQRDVQEILDNNPDASIDEVMDVFSIKHPKARRLTITTYMNQYKLYTMVLRAKLEIAANQLIDNIERDERLDKFERLYAIEIERQSILRELGQ